MIDHQPPRREPYAFGAHQPKPVRAADDAGLAERRGRRSGQIASKPCPLCAAEVPLDSRRMRMADGRAVIVCPSCRAPVGVRRADLYRTPPDEALPAPDGRPRKGLWGRKGA